MLQFSEMGLPQTILHALENQGFTTPTPIQAQSIPLALAGKDILGSAQTGTGKTLAFALPLINHLLNNPESMALVLTPTRELAGQVNDHIQKILGRKIPVKTALLIGGDPYSKQLFQLKSARIIIGTPGRIIDHMENNAFNPQIIDFLILDETDRMFDMGFGIQLQEIINQLPSKRQTLMFSATFPPSIEKLAKKQLIQPERISIGSLTMAPQNIKQEFVHVKDTEKYPTLLSELEKREGSIVIFVKTKIMADKLSYRLTKDDHNASAIHGDLRQTKRERVIRGFRSNRFHILVATDVAARGLDVPHVEHVINYDAPQNPEDYIHRIGRTARAGKEGSSLSFITPDEKKKWFFIDKKLKGTSPFEDESYSKPARGRGGQSSFNKRGGSSSRSEGGEGRGFRRDSDAPRAPRPEGREGGENRSFRKDSGSSFGRAPRPEGREGGGERSFRKDSGSSFGRAPRPEGREGGERSFRKDSGSSFGRAPRPEGREGGGERSFRKDSGSSFGRAPRPEGREGGGERSFRKDSGNSFGRAPRAEGRESGGERSFRKDSGSSFGRAPRPEGREGGEVRSFRKDSDSFGRGPRSEGRDPKKSFANKEGKPFKSSRSSEGFRKDDSSSERSNKRESSPGDAPRKKLSLSMR
jgi:ATP-dependent RNA helicase DeaD